MPRVLPSCRKTTTMASVCAGAPEPGEEGPELALSEVEGIRPDWSAPHRSLPDVSRRVTRRAPPAQVIAGGRAEYWFRLQPCLELQPLPGLSQWRAGRWPVPRHRTIPPPV